MAEKYQCPYLCNHFCATECEIGKQYVPEIRIKELPQIILEMLASLNYMQKKKERLIEITSDGVIEEEEIKDFLVIQKELAKISVTAETLRLWVEQRLASGEIDPDVYRSEKQKS